MGSLAILIVYKTGFVILKIHLPNRLDIAAAILGIQFNAIARQRSLLSRQVVVSLRQRATRSRSCRRLEAMARVAPNVVGEGRFLLQLYYPTKHIFQRILIKPFLLLIN